VSRRWPSRSTASGPQIWMRTKCGDAKVMPISWQYAARGGQMPPTPNGFAGGRCGVKLIRCECGFVARGESDDQVVGAIRGHMAADHPALLESVSREDLLSWIRVE
jgi:predicted small metal-binding protein